MMAARVRDSRDEGVGREAGQAFAFVGAAGQRVAVGRYGSVPDPVDRIGVGMRPSRWIVPMVARLEDCVAV